MKEAKLINLSEINQKRRQEAFDWALEEFMNSDFSKESVPIRLDPADATYARYHCVPSLFCDRKTGKTLFRRDWLDDDTFNCVAVSNLSELCSEHSGDYIKYLLDNGIKIYRYLKNPFAPANPAQFFG